LTLVCGDSSSGQIELLLAGKVNALVGQEPFLMGSSIVKVLWDMYSGKPPTEKIILGTSLLELVHAPVQKPDLNVNGNGLGSLKIVGFVSFSMVATLAVACIYWTYSKRNIRVVKASQPLFLIMIATGVLIMSGALIPLSLPDSSNQQFQNNNCMATPWLLVLGFSCTFAALFSKTWRINQIFNCPDGNYARVVVKETDVLIPFCALMTTNVIIMACWTALNPLVQTVNSKAGTDLWGRTISTYYACESVEEEGVWVFLVPLGLINIGVLLVAFWQAFRARSITSEFSETRYIFLVMMSLSQAFLTGLPILFVVREQPSAFYLIWVFLILVVCLSVLLLIFVPKILYERKFKKLRTSEQNAVFQNAVETSTGAKKKRIRQRRNYQTSTTTKQQQQNNELTSSQLGEKADPTDTNSNQVHLSSVEKEDEENSNQKETIPEYHDELEDGVPCEEGKGDNNNQPTLVT
jgi:gamma-aminobutyric acid type B receptor